MEYEKINCKSFSSRKIPKKLIKSECNNIYMDDVLCIFNIIDINIFENLKILKKGDKNIYISNNLKIIIKENNDYNELIREYFIGVVEINKLRYKIPTFLYTFGLYTNTKDNCNSKLLIENIQGNTMRYLLNTQTINFNDYLGMFLQILISLEIAQIDIGFCHYDFHTANLMCRNIKELHNIYTIVLENNIFEIHPIKYLPVIIDFGLSCVKSRGNNIGEFELYKYGMYNFMLPGVDIYKFLISSCIDSKGDLRSEIIDLLEFYGEEEPYKVLISYEGFEDAKNEYMKKGSISKIATKTPMEFFNWILNKYPDIASIYIKKSNRNIYIPSLTFSIKENPKLLKKRIFKLHTFYKSSYIICKYLLHISGGSIFFLDFLNTHSKKIIQNDIELLNGYKKLIVPNMQKIKKYSEIILNTKLWENNKSIFSKYLKSISFFKDILQFLQFLYIIRELELNFIYKVFTHEFLQSEQYKTYNDNYILINKTSRWVQSVKDSLKF
jgi:hypothetical protein